MPRLREGGSRRLMSNPRGRYKCVSALAAMRSNHPVRELVRAPGVNRMIKSAATVSPIPPPRKGEEEIKRRVRSLLGGSAAFLCLVLAFGAEFLARLAVKSLGIGLLGAFQRGRAMGHRRLRSRGGRRGGLCECGTHQEQGCDGGR